MSSMFTSSFWLSLGNDFREWRTMLGRPVRKLLGQPDVVLESETQQESVQDKLSHNSGACYK